MTRVTRRLLAAAAVVVAGLAAATLWFLRGYQAEGLHLGDIALPPEFAIAVYASSVPGARSLALGEHGTVFVGTRTPGVVYALVDADHDGVAEEVDTVARGLHVPNGVAFRGGVIKLAARS